LLSLHNVFILTALLLLLILLLVIPGIINLFAFVVKA